jgi:hypothetical protein
VCSSSLRGRLDGEPGKENPARHRGRGPPRSATPSSRGIPGGQGSSISPPFNIFTKESEKEFEKKLKELNKKKD